MPGARCGSLSRGLTARRLIWFAGEWHRQEAGEALFLKRVSQFHSSLARSLLRGLCDALRQLALLLLLRIPTGYGFHLRWTLRKCRASALGVAPTRIASQGVTRADREFKNGDTIMYLTVMWNWVSLFQRVSGRGHSPVVGVRRRGCKDEMAAGAQLLRLAPSAHLSATEKRMKSSQLVSEIRWDRVPFVAGHGDARPAPSLLRSQRRESFQC